MIDSRIDLAGPRDSCSPACDRFVEKWEAWYDRAFDGYPPALLEITDTDTYLDRVGSKTRNMIRKAARHGYLFREFDRNDELDAIATINRSKPIRSGGPMRDNYLADPQPTAPGPRRLCDRHGQGFVGMYDDRRLAAYCHLVISNDLAIVNTVLGHADDLPRGVMNGLFYAVIAGLHDRNTTRPDTPTRWLNYLTLAVAPGLARFKRSVGFEATTIERRQSQ